MLGTATHDTKRGEDARARLNVLSEMPTDWGQQLSRWARINAANRLIVEGVPAPDRNDEYLFYQALIGSWPPELTDPSKLPLELLERFRAFMLKAVREAKIHTSWITQNAGYEEATARFVERTLTGPTGTRFLSSFLPFQQRIAALGAVNSLAQVVLKLVCPGVSDFYQGTELWDLSLVDPDNRRPINYPLRRAWLEELLPMVHACRTGHLPHPSPTHLLEAWPDGRIKLFITAAGLRLRRELADVFLHGDYQPIVVEGPTAHHLVGVRRERQGTVIIGVVPRLICRLSPANGGLPARPTIWHDTRLLLPPGDWQRSYTDVLSGRTLVAQTTAGRPYLNAEQLLQDLPVALLVSSPMASEAAERYRT